MGAGGAAFAVLPLLISGYLFNLIFYRLRYFSSRAEGQKLFFMAAGSGVVIGAFVFLVSGLLKFVPFLRGSVLFDVAAAVNVAVPVPHASRLLLLLFFSVLSPFFLNVVLWVFLRKTRSSAAKAVYERLIEKFGNSMSQLFRKAAEEQKMVMVTLSSRKIYCGRILEIPSNIDSGDACIELLPAFSAYRDKDTLQMGREKTSYKVIALWEARRYLQSLEKMKLKLESKISDLLESLPEDFTEKDRPIMLGQIESLISNARRDVEKYDAAHVDIKDWVKVIPVREIESASFYDATLYEKWFSAPVEVEGSASAKGPTAEVGLMPGDSTLQR